MITFKLNSFFRAKTQLPIMETDEASIKQGQAVAVHISGTKLFKGVVLAAPSAEVGAHALLLSSFVVRRDC